MPTVPTYAGNSSTIAPTSSPGTGSGGFTTPSAGNAVGALGQLYAGYAGYQAGRANEALANWNADTLDLQAQDAITQGFEAEGRLRRNVVGLVGVQRAGFSNQGVDVNQGSAADVQIDTVRQGETDALTVRNNAAREAWAYRVRAAQTRAEGEQAAASGRSQAVGGVLGAFGSLLR